MFAIIKDNHKYINVKLNNHFVYKGIEINKIQDDYFINVENKYYIKNYDNNSKLEYKQYEIINKSNLNTINLFIYKSDKGISDYNLYNKQDFIIANHTKANIKSHNKYSDKYYLLYKDNYLKTNYEGLSYNGHIYNNELIKTNDYIDYFGLHIIFYDDFIYINNFEIECLLPIKRINEKVLKVSEDIKAISNYYEKNQNDIELSKLKEIKLPLRNNNRNLILQIGPSITMSLGMLMVASINLYTNYIGRINYASILMPSIMLFSGLVWPIITNAYDKRKYTKEYRKIKNEYFNYLKKYESESITQLKSYKDYELSYFFDEYAYKDKLFYIVAKSKHFLQISIGYYNRIFEIESNITQDEELDEYIGRIKYEINDIGSWPLFINLKENKRITLLVENKEYYIKKVLLELSYKYHYDDLGIILYSKNKKLIEEIYNLPHFFEKGIRRTFLEEHDLFETCKKEYAKPTILITDENIDTNLVNENIITIYFGSNEKDILKDSSIVVDCLKDVCVLQDRNSSVEFITKEVEIDFDEAFSFIAKYTNYDLKGNDLSFNKLHDGLNIIDNYNAKQEMLLALFAYSNGKALRFDLHESKDGPHGLIGGSTGSGKSELIVSLLISLAIKYRPDYLNIILIDYKGGGIKESLSYKGECIPHIVASIDNLEPDIFERLIEAISRECKKRQELFKSLSVLSFSSIMSIDDYLMNYERFNYPKIAHLLIVVDEFAELKKENPEIIKELISFSRIGRSLGLHLILATQKPSGIIDDEIWSNSHFKIALKVNSEKDSLDIIKTKDSAYLTKPGTFNLRVDDHIIEAKSIYSKNDINQKNDKEVILLDEKLDIKTKKIIRNNKPVPEAGYIASLINEASEKLKIKNEKIVFKKPDPLTINCIKEKYNTHNKIVFGEIDDYKEASISALMIENEKNILISSSRENEINNILIQLNVLKIETVVISNKLYKGNNIIGSCLYEQDADIKYVFNKLSLEKDRQVSIVIEDYNSFVCYDDNYSNLLFKLIRKTNLNNVNVILLSNLTNINFKILNLFEYKVLINSKDSQDLLNLFSSRSAYKGDSFYKEKKIIPFVPCLIEEYKSHESSKEDYLDSIPEIVRYERNDDSTFIGYDVKTRKKVYIHNFEKLLIVAIKEDYLSLYKRIYKDKENIIVKPYEPSLTKENFDAYLWIKEGINIQRLFYIDINEESIESFLYKGNKGIILAPVNHE